MLMEECLCCQLQTCTHVFVNIDGNVDYDDPLLEVRTENTVVVLLE